MADQKLRDLVVDALANDYEQLATIQGEVELWAAEAGLPCTTDQLLGEIAELISNGQVEACKYDSSREAFFVESFRSDLADTYWYRLTSTGETLLQESAQG